jgi:UrcA family protein
MGQEGTDGRLPSRKPEGDQTMYRTEIGQRMTRRIAGAALLLTSCLALMPPTATASEVQTRRVKIVDLDLSSPAGRQALDRRLRIAIEQVCAPRGSARVRAATDKQARECMLGARADVQRQLDQQGVSLLLASGR